MKDLLWLTLLLFIVAALLRSELFFYLLYVVVGLQLIAWFWLRRSSQQIHWSRSAPPAAFLNDPVEVTISVGNDSLLPLAWVSIDESVAPQLALQQHVREVFALGAGKQREFRYTIAGTRRGYYPLGPLVMRTGDVLGLGERSLRSRDTAGITIYPQVVPLAALDLPAALPYGTLPTHQRLFSDPSRPAGVRPYQPPDGIRQIDWKSTAHTGMPQVRRHQPAIAYETLVALAFARTEYDSRFTYDEMEHAIVAAASLAADLVQRHQAVGLLTNGRDPLAEQPGVLVPTGTGRPHLMSILSALGRLQPIGEGQIIQMLREHPHSLGWGSTLLIVTGGLSSALIAGLLPLKQRGLHIALILTDASPSDLALARQHGIAAFRVRRDGSVTE